MKIESSSVAIATSHQLRENHDISERLNLWQDGNSNPAAPLPQLEEQKANKDQLRISTLAKHLFHQLQSGRATEEITYPAAGGELSIEISPEDQQKLMILERLWEQLTGRKISLQVPTTFVAFPQNHGVPVQSANADRNAEEERLGWGLEYDYHEHHHEQEQMLFTSQGIIKTADGREMNFSADLRMSREFHQTIDLSIRAGDAKLTDPLIINFTNEGVSLSEQKFAFDLDLDGNDEQISLIKPGSGFLALDRNGDGIINNGGELFGPRSGSGFADLAVFDEDDNQWIDENDAIFSRLRIWTYDEEGNSSLFALGKKGIGAIYLGGQYTPFALKNSANELLGKVSATSVYLCEQGAAGTIQEIDLAV
ncbi:MAG: hypothetical protein JXO49_02790 [Deltaproteobacteria bacterium]|nr:hypothetical protein [Candidatus Anaeroferrophillus wilburensis]MBN2888256.1 hypothetical protein [Deltaproteobacteria bacterium]